MSTTADVLDDRILVHPSFADMYTVAAIPGGRWDGARTVWSFPATERYAEIIRGRIRKLGTTDAFEALLHPTPAEVAPVPAPAPAAEQPEPLPAPVIVAPPEPEIILPPGLKTTPWRHQKAAYKFALERFAAGFCGLLLAMGMGTGKTLVALMIMLFLRAKRVMIVAPLRVVHVWLTQIGLHVGIDVIVVALDEEVGSVAKKRQLAEEKMRLAETLGVPFICVINYDSAWREPFSTWAERVQWDLVIADECVPTDTMIETPTGPVPIQRLRAGDTVLGLDALGHIVHARVARTFRGFSHRPLVQIESLLATADHPVWVEGSGYIPAAAVRPGDSIRIYENHHHHLRMVRSVVHENNLRQLEASLLRQGVFGALADVPAGICGEHPCETRPEQNVGTDEAESPEPGIHGAASGIPAFRPESLVFNLETSTGNYFASGVLVHNCHRLKAPGGKASMFFKRLRPHARHRVALTGTPLPHSLLDVYGPFRFLDVAIFGTSFHAFRQSFTIMGGYQNKQIVGFRNTEDFERRMSKITFRVGKEVLDLPPETHVTYYCELNAEARRIYRDLEEDLVARVLNGTVTAANALVKLLRLQQVAGGTLKTDDGVLRRVDNAKQRLLSDTLEDIGADEPVVVFCRFHADLDAVHEACEANGFSSLELSGRRDELRRWQAGEAQVLAVQISAGGVGVDLTRARYSTYYSLSFSLGEYDQSLSRVHRPGQTRPVEHIHLVARGTVDQRIMRALEKRAEVVESILAEIKH